jgi:hypothetical protein
MRHSFLTLMVAVPALLVAAELPNWVQPREMDNVKARKNFWSFQPVQKPAVPAVESKWVRNPLDAFVLEKLREKKEEPRAELDRRALMRRAMLDITGLPPTPNQMREFLADKSPDAYEKLVDRLMAGTAYGERWGQRWLDIVRYADTNGYELDAERTHAWRYRDYVIRSFNANKPFDRFLKEQIAGDELWPADTDALVATGFHRTGPEHIVGGNQDLEMNRQEVLIEMNAGVGNVFLGLTVQCARCHNHKFDPFLQADYYRLAAIFAGTEGREVAIATPLEWASYSFERYEWEQKVKPILDAIKAIEKPYRAKLKAEKRAQLEPKFRDALAVPEAQRTKEQAELAKNAESQIGSTWDEVLAAIPPAELAVRKGWREKLHELELIEPEPPPHAYAAVNSGKPHATHILKVGDHKMKQGQVEPGVPLVLALARGQQDLGDVTRDVAGRRAQLAEWLASGDHPLTARVFVNRMWQFRMGDGIVKTPNDFGTLGERPTNPKLLDWMASEFVASGWDIKKLDRMILTSSTYRQTATQRRRLDAEMVRDSILAVSGQLNPKMYGPPVKTPIEQEIYDIIFTEQEPDNLWPLPKDRREMYRRTVYVLNKRTVRLPMLANFDQPDTMSSCPQRANSTHALQALTMMNSDFMAESAKAFAARLGKKDPVGDAYSLALTRQPRPEERKLAEEFFKKGGTVADFALALLNRNEFIYLP